MGPISLWNAAIAYLGLVALMSVVSFVFYGFDKRRAVRGGRRVPEQTLHLMALLGGWPGALLGQRQFRHKTSKLSFLMVFWAVVVMHIAAVVGGVAFALMASSSGTAATPASGSHEIRIEPLRRSIRSTFIDDLDSTASGKTVDSSQRRRVVDGRSHPGRLQHHA